MTTTHRTLNDMVAANPIAAATVRYLNARHEFFHGPEAGANTWCVEVQDAETALATVLTNSTAVDSDELAWLKWFYTNVDLGPGGDDYRADLANMFEAETGMTLPPEIREAI